mmetsp:Transcript_61121/g.171260  ORF Transcript_61121/g.171260 Transcript_61121/m.171260 type:complete len:245 (-) Transcript_61121:13-747(-)
MICNRVIAVVNDPTKAADTTKAKKRTNTVNIRSATFMGVTTCSPKKRANIAWKQKAYLVPRSPSSACRSVPTSSHGGKSALAWMPYQTQANIWIMPNKSSNTTWHAATSIKPSERIMNSKIRFWFLMRRLKRASRMARSMPRKFQPALVPLIATSDQSQTTMSKSIGNLVLMYCLATLAGRNSTTPCDETKPVKKETRMSRVQKSLADQFTTNVKSDSNGSRICKGMTTMSLMTRSKPTSSQQK